MIPRLAACVLVPWLACAAATAQAAGPGLTWSGSSGGSAGSYWPSCANLPVTTVAGESVRLTVWGDPNSPFALLAAATATGCQPFPGLGNALVLDPPLVPLIVGTLTQATPCLSCPPGLEPLQLVVPPGVPKGAAVSFQAVGYGSGRPSFTVAITATVG